MCAKLDKLAILEYCSNCKWTGPEALLTFDEDGNYQILCPKCNEDITYSHTPSNEKENSSVLAFAWYLFLAFFFSACLITIIFLCIVIMTFIHVVTWFKYADPKKFYWKVMKTLNEIFN